MRYIKSTGPALHGTARIEDELWHRLSQQLTDEQLLDLLLV